MILTIRLVLHIKWAVLLKSITLILLFVCCTQPCLFREFENSSGFVIDEPLTNSLFATYSILLNFMWCNVRLFLPEWKCNSVSLYFVICQCCAYAMATKTFFLYNWQPALHLIIPVYIIFKTCAASFAGDWDLTKYWPLLKLAATSFSSEF